MTVLPKEYWRCFVFIYSIGVIPGSRGLSKILDNNLTASRNDVSYTKIKDCSCGVHYEIRGRIIGGRTAKESEFPWQVAIFHKNLLMCGGSLINDRYILSAAHCFKTVDHAQNTVKTLPQDKIVFVLGGHSISELSNMSKRKPTIVQRRPSYILIHPFYNPFNFECDMSLSKLNKPVKEYTYNILPVCLPPQHDSFVDTVATISGWGAVSERGGPVGTLRKTTVRVLPNNVCKKKLRQYFDEEIMLCAASPGHDACQGDSGGPIVARHSKYKYIQIGIVSYGIGCGDINYPGVYTRVNRFLQWIKHHTEDAYYCQP